MQLAFLLNMKIAPANMVSLAIKMMATFIWEQNSDKDKQVFLEWHLNFIFISEHMELFTFLMMFLYICAMHG